MKDAFPENKNAIFWKTVTHMNKINETKKFVNQIRIWNLSLYAVQVCVLKHETHCTLVQIITLIQSELNF